MIRDSYTENLYEMVPCNNRTINAKNNRGGDEMLNDKDAKEMDWVNREANEEAAQDYLRIRMDDNDNFGEGQ
ncbi:hypothetical protein Desgi_0892 [Desulfoscipio gibsoniae DSM 7213]|uniref:Uncharacterized protein n=1 Tax=Desulfoscipio gibsoniae DSM 7213 TaxID=767817 RepID=R4KIR6_9FIRM|nr:hypothetical protein Desgi_0892 [Desulfoscipio gibsoniae DSM 7213]